MVASLFVEGAIIDLGCFKIRMRLFEVFSRTVLMLRGRTAAGESEHSLTFRPVKPLGIGARLVRPTARSTGSGRPRVCRF